MTPSFSFFLKCKPIEKCLHYDKKSQKQTNATKMNSLLRRSAAPPCICMQRGKKRLITTVHTQTSYGANLTSSTSTNIALHLYIHSQQAWQTKFSVKFPFVLFSDARAKNTHTHISHTRNWMKESNFGVFYMWESKRCQLFLARMFWFVGRREKQRWRTNFDDENNF